MFTVTTFHIGGDENNGKEWDANPIIQEFKKRMK
jgi:hexosaminidase